MLPSLKRSFFPLLFLVFAFLAFHAEVLLTSKTYINLWIFKHHLPFQNLFPNIYNFLNQSSDFITHYLANTFFMLEALRKGIFPLWNPYVFCGFPIFANGSSVVFSPMNLLFIFLSPFSVIKIQMVLTFLGGGILLYVLLTHYYHLNAFPSLCGALIYVFCPFLQENIDAGSLLGFVWSFPALVILIERCFQKIKLIRFFWLGAFLAFSCYTTHIHVVLNELFLVLVYGGYKFFCIPQKRLRKQSFIYLIFSALVFFGLSSIQLFPFFEFFWHSQRNILNGAPAGWLIPSDPLTSLYPVALKIPRIQEFLSLVFGAPVTVMGRGVYLGVFAFFSGVFVSLYALKQRLKGNVCLFIGIFILYYGVAIIPIERFIPFYSLLMARFWTLFIFSTAILTAYTVHYLFERGGIAIKLFEKIRNAIFLFFVLPVTFCSLLFSVFSLRFKEMLFKKISSVSTGISQQHHFYDRFNLFFDEIHSLITIGSPWIWIPFFVCLALFLFCFILKKQRKYLRPSYLYILIISFILLDLFVIGSLVRPSAIEEEKLFGTPRALSFLQKDADLFRFVSIQSPSQRVLKPNLGSIYGLYDIGGQESLIDRHYLLFAQRVLQRRLPDAIDAGGILDFKNVDLKLFGMLNVKYILADENQTAGFSETEQALNADGINIYRNPYYLPRAFLVSNYEKVSDENRVFEKLLRADFDPKKVVFLEKSVPKYFSLGKKTNSRVRILSYDPHDIKISVETPQDSLLVLSDTYFPGWKATVDGVPVPIFRANGILRSIAVTKGRHLVTFSYRPLSLKLGIFVFLGTILLLCLSQYKSFAKTLF